MRSQVVRTEMSYRSYNQSQMSSSYGVSPLVRWNTRGLVNLTLLETFVAFDLTVYIVVHPSPGTKVEVVRQNEETNGFLHNPASLSVVGNRHSIDRNILFCFRKFASGPPSNVCNTLKK